MSKFVMDTAGVNEKGNLTLGGVDCVELAKKYGTPLYVIDEDAVIDHCRQYKNSIDKYYGGKGKVLYASKALSAVFMYKTVKECGLGVDVVSGGELFTALKAGTDPADICFHGNNKTADELKMAVDCGVGRIIVDNNEELLRLNKIAGDAGKNVKIMFRIKPGVDAHTHEFIMTGQIDSKFGVALENGEAIEIMRTAAALPNVTVVGADCHIGSQIFEVAPFKLTAKRMIEFMAQVRREVGIELTELNLGGGFGIKYTSKDDPVPYESYIHQVRDIIEETCAEQNMPLPYIYMEPGRSIVASAGLTLYTVGGVKEIKDVRNYVSVDGGMCDNPRYALYKSEYSLCVANKADAPADYVATVAGKCCESGDLIQENVKMTKPTEGDILAVFATGAYNYSMASNYNRNPRPAMVAVKGGADRLVISRETYEDLIKNDVLD